MTEPDKSRPLQDTAPCVGCGLCCDGTLYVRAQVAEGEEQRMLESGLELLTHQERPFFRQPCPHHSAGRCTIYNERFHVCHAFRCKLLKRYHAGEIDLGEARSKIDGAFELLREVNAEDPSADLSAERVRLRRELGQQLLGLDQNERAAIARRLLKLVAADVYLDRWFREESSSEEATDSNSCRKTPTERTQRSPVR